MTQGVQLRRQRARLPDETSWAVRTLDAVGHLVCVCEDGRITYINPAGLSALGMGSIDDALDLPFARFLRRDDRDLVETLPSEGYTGLPVPATLIRTDGGAVEVELVLRRLDSESGSLLMIEAQDVTEQKRAVEALRRGYDDLEMRIAERARELSQEMAERRRVEESLRLTGQVIERLSEGVVILGPDFTVTSVNPAFSQITGYDADSLLGKPPPFIDSMRNDEDLHREMWEYLGVEERWEGEFWDRTREGEAYAIHLSVSAIAGEDGGAPQFAAVISDITKRKQDEERILYQANYDVLTGLPNRALFMDRLNQSIANTERSGAKLGLLFIDLDGFKLVNDTLGHDIGDMLLKEAGRRLVDCVRAGDTVARLGGDEFTVVMPNLTDGRHVTIVAQRILNALSDPFRLEGHESFVSGSIGITIFPDDAREASELLKNADSAMYRAKDQGKATYQYFTSDLNEEAQQRLAIKNGLSKAMERDEFTLNYQPKLDLSTGGVHSVEALMRWSSKELGPVPPGKFIPVMEESGMVVEMGAWVIRSACRQHLAWREAGLPPVRVAVNLSARQLRDTSFVTLVENLLDEEGVGPEGLEIEITESMLMSDSARAVIALRGLHELGIRIAMDDFGTGYSSLSYLKRFPIDTIKIDRSFVADISTSADDAEIIRTIISMGKTLNRRIVAEGVETAEQIDVLRQYNCDEVQGYFISPPVPADSLTGLLRDHAGTSD